jgi:hypothetical protein
VCGRTGGVPQEMLSGGRGAELSANGAALRKRAARLPFAVHQVVEYLIAAFLISSTPQFTPRGAEAVFGAALAFAVLAAVSDGWVGLGWVSRPLHAALDWIVLAGVGAAPFLLRITSDMAAVLVIEGAVVVMLCIAPVTSYTRSTRVRRRPAVPRPTHPTPPRVAGARPSVPVARTAGRVAGTVSRQGPRSLGRAVGRAQRRGRLG